MNQLPKEIFIPIISYLPLCDKLNCIRVCHRWHQIISNTNLYDRLQFQDPEMIHQTISLFDANQHVGRHVDRLNIIDCNLNMQSVLTLPQLLPNIRRLNWIEDTSCGEAVDYPPNYKEAFEHWNHVEQIMNMSKYYHTATYLFGSSVFYKLRRLDILFDTFVMASERADLRVASPLLKGLLENIKNAPALEIVSLRYTEIDLNDMEMLHAGTPKLQKLELDSVYLASTTTGNCIKRRKI